MSRDSDENAAATKCHTGRDDRGWSRPGKGAHTACCLALPPSRFRAVDALGLTRAPSPAGRDQQLSRWDAGKSREVRKEKSRCPRCPGKLSPRCWLRTSADGTGGTRAHRTQSATLRPDTSKSDRPLEQTAKGPAPEHVRCRLLVLLSLYDTVTRYVSCTRFPWDEAQDTHLQSCHQ